MSTLDRSTHILKTRASSSLAPRLALPVRAGASTISLYSTARRPGRERLGITGTGVDWRVIRALMIVVALLGDLSFFGAPLV